MVQPASPSAAQPSGAAPAADEAVAALVAGVDANAAWSEVENVLASPLFAGAQSHQRLLRYLVEHSLAGRLTMLKETMLGIEVFMRPADSFDPRRDSIVRVEARRLRERLRQHYAEDQSSELIIDLPRGSYRPQFLTRPRDSAVTAATELVERGLFFLRQGHEEGHRKALQRFEDATRTAPDFAAAHSGVARAWLQLVATNLEPPLPGIDHALAAVRRALELQPRHAESLVLAAQLTHRFEFDWTAAQALFERAARAAPGSAYVRHSHALSLMMRGEFARADAELAAARQLDPIHLGLRAHQALLHLYRRDWSAAEAALRALLDMGPDNVLGMSLLAYCALCRGDAAAALRQYRSVSERHPQLSIGPAGEIQSLALLGERSTALQRLQQLVGHWPGRYLSPYQLAMAQVRLDEPDAAIALLTRAVGERDPNALCLPVDPAFDSLGGHPRFDALRRTVLGSPAEPAKPAVGEGPAAPSP